MKKSFTLIMGLMLLSLLVSNSCTKKEDDDSAYQLAGNYGNANLVSSENFVLNTWVTDWNDGTNFVYTSYIDWPAITQDIMDHGAIMVYWKLYDYWVALPSSYSSSSLSYNKIFSVKLGLVKIEYIGYNSLGAEPVSDVIGQLVRVVAISAAALQAHPGLNLNNYNEVKDALQLQDK